MYSPETNTQANGFTYHPQVNCTIRPPRNIYDFQHIRVVGHSNFLRSAPLNDDICNPTPDPIFCEFLETNPQFLDFFEHAKHGPSSITNKRFMKSVLKCDAPKIKPNDAFFELAKDYTYRMLAPYMQGKRITSKIDYNGTTTNGFPYNKMIDPDTKRPYHTKAELINSPIFKDELYRFHTPLWQMFGKKEYLPMAELLDDKLRTVYCGETPFVFWQKFMFDTSDAALKAQADNFSACWSRYGHVKQYGGTNRLATNHQLFYRILECTALEILHYTADISGWDRLLPIMEDIYNIRARLYGPMDEFETKVFNYLKKNICTVTCVLPDGTLIEKDIGNVSGSGKTTTDNTIGHILIEFYHFIRIYYRKYGKMPTYVDIIVQVRNSLYGDDSFTSIRVRFWLRDDDLSTPDKEADLYFNLYRETYSLFGLTVKASQFNFNYGDVSGLEFLGVTFRKSSYNVYAGEPRYSKIFTTITQVLEKANREPMAYASICGAVCTLSCGLTDPLALRLQSFVQAYASFLNIHFQDSLPETVLYDLGKIARGSYHSGKVAFGFESATEVFENNNNLFFFFPQSRLPRERVGFKNLTMSIKKDFKDLNILQNLFRERFAAISTFSTFLPSFNYVGAVLEFCQQYRCEFPSIAFSSSGPHHTLDWSSELKFYGVSFKLSGFPSKQECRNYSYFKLIYVLCNPNEQALSTVCKVCSTSYRTGFNHICEAALDDDSLVEYAKQLSLSAQPSAPEIPIVSTTPVSTFHIHFLKAIKVYFDLKLEHRPFHPLHGIFTDSEKSAAARMAMMLKEGSFNPYGNGQWPLLVPFMFLWFSVNTPNYGLFVIPSDFKEGGFNPYGNGQSALSEYFDIFRPTCVINPDGNITCFGTVHYDTRVPVACSGTGPDTISAFEEWILQVSTKLSDWSPDVHPLFSALLTLPLPESVPHILFQHIKAPHAYHSFMRMLETSSVASGCCSGAFHSGITQGNGKKAPIPIPSIANARRFIRITKPIIAEDLSFTYNATFTVSLDGGAPAIALSTGESTPGSAFNNFLSDVTNALYDWEPTTSLGIFLKALRTMPPPPTDHPLSCLWTDDYDHTLDKILEGSFNPYGNGQPAPMTYNAYLLRNQANFKKLTPAQRKAKYTEYVRNFSKVPKVMTTVKQDNHNHVSATRKQDAKASTNLAVSGVVTTNAIAKERMNKIKSLKTGITTLSPCARIYYAALVCPFFKLDSECDRLLQSLQLSAYKEENPCIPTMPNVKSRKFQAWARGEFQCSSAPGGIPGSAFITFAPRRLANDGNPAMGGVCPIYVSTPSWIAPLGATIPDVEVPSPITPPGSYVGYNLNTDYPSTALPLVTGRGIKYRVVGSGLRIRYIGTEINRGGIVHCTVTPNHDTVALADINQLGQLETYSRYPVTRDWVEIMHSPVMEDDFLYRPDQGTNPSYYTTLFSTAPFEHYMVQQVTDCVGGAFEWQAVVHFEAVGAEVRGLTPTPVDVTGVSAVLNVATPTIIPEINKLSQDNKDIGTLLKDGMNMVSGLAPEVLKMGTMMFGNI